MIDVFSYMLGKKSGGGGSEQEDGLVTRTLTAYENSTVSSVGSYAFYSFLSLMSVDLANVGSVGAMAFGFCPNLTSANLPNVTSIGGSAFRGCNKLTSIDLPNVTTIDNGAFYSCNSLSLASLSRIQTIGSSAFYSCYHLLSLYLPYSDVCSIANNAFTGTPIAGYTASTGGVYGSIYVPASLYYKYYNRYSSFKSRFARIESPITITLVGIGLSLSATTYPITWLEWSLGGPEPEDFRVEILAEGDVRIHTVNDVYCYVYKDEDLTIRCTENDMIEETTYYLNFS